MKLHCRWCKAEVLITRDPRQAAAIVKWQGRKRAARPFVQDAFPSLSDDAREMLVSGTCPKCWEEMFGS